jgi:hypothetical protein
MFVRDQGSRTECHDDDAEAEFETSYAQVLVHQPRR